MEYRNTFARLPACLLLTAGLAMTGGCGGDGATEPPIATAEAELLATALVDVSFDALFRGIGQVIASEPTEQGERPLMITVECPGGGEAALEGVVTGTVEPGASYDVEVVAELDLRSCRHDDGILDTAASAPPPELVAGLAALDGEPVGDQVVEITGRVAWAAGAGDDPVACGVELAAVHDPIGRRRVLQGAVCGRDVQTSHTLED